MSTKCLYTSRTLNILFSLVDGTPCVIDVAGPPFAGSILAGSPLRFKPHCFTWFKPTEYNVNGTKSPGPGAMKFHGLIANEQQSTARAASVSGLEQPGLTTKALAEAVECHKPVCNHHCLQPPHLRRDPYQYCRSACSYCSRLSSALYPCVACDLAVCWLCFSPKTMSLLDSDKDIPLRRPQGPSRTQHIQ